MEAAEAVRYLSGIIPAGDEKAKEALRAVELAAKTREIEALSHEVSEQKKKIQFYEERGGRGNA